MTRTRLAGAVVAATLSAATLGLAVPAHADTSSASWSGVAGGYDNVIEGHSATVETFSIEGGDPVEAVCIQYGVPLNEEATFHVVPRDQAGVNGAGRAAWVGAQHRFVGTPLDDPNLEAVATQLAAWTFTDGLTYTDENVNNQQVRDRVETLVDAAEHLSAPNSTFDLAVDVARDGATLVATATLTGDNDAPLAGQNVVFTLTGDAEGEVEATTDALGKATVTSADATGAGTMTVSWVGALPAGAVLMPDDGSQAFVTTEPATLRRAATADFAAAPAPEPTDEPAPEPTDEPAPEPDPEPAPEADEPQPTPPPAEEPPAETTELPYTGPEDALLPLGALVAAGVGLYGWRLRRRAGS